jgi:predicted N-acetyltransferase YhbS
MYVAEGRRGQGIGSRLLESISGAIGSSGCWCIPYSHLTEFYSRIGFYVCDEEAIPPFLVERWERYTGSGQKVVIMKRSET